MGTTDVESQKRSRKEAKIEKYISRHATKLAKRAVQNEEHGYEFRAVQRIFLYGWNARIQDDRDFLKEVADRTLADLGIPLQLKGGPEEYLGVYNNGIYPTSPFYYLVFIKA